MPQNESVNNEELKIKTGSKNKFLFRDRKKINNPMYFYLNTIFTSRLFLFGFRLLVTYSLFAIGLI